MADSDIVEEGVKVRGEYMLTTVDNPFDPFTEWDEWLQWDMSSGYNTPGLLARIARQSPDLSDADQHNAVQDAIDEIVAINVLGVHRKVKAGDVKALAEQKASAS